MTTDAAIEKLRALPPDKRQEAVDFIEFLHERSMPKRPRRSVKGLWVGLHDKPITEQDIAEARREMWGNFPREDQL